VHRRGLFITFEGGEGAGKTTQIRLLVDWLKMEGVDVVQTREPGGTEGAERIRELLVTGARDRWDAVCETALFLTARRQHVEQLISPALAHGATVVCDRFADSTMVYQGIGKGLGLEYLSELGRLIVGDIQPDITFLLDIEPTLGLARASGRSGSETRFESYDVVFHKSIRDGFLQIAEHSPNRIKVIDASQNVEVIHAQIIAHIKSVTS
jgi:dTMP kinase